MTTAARTSDSKNETRASASSKALSGFLARPQISAMIVGFRSRVTRLRPAVCRRRAASSALRPAALDARRCKDAATGSRPTKKAPPYRRRIALDQVHDLCSRRLVKFGHPSIWARQRTDQWLASTAKFLISNEVQSTRIAVFHAAHEIHRVAVGSARSRLGSISAPHWMQMPYVPWEIRFSAS